MKAALTLIFFISALVGSNAQAIQGIFDGNSNVQVQISTVLESVLPGNILILGENHGLGVHQSQHLQIIQALKDSGLKVSLGMEFFTYLDQVNLNEFKAGKISEAEMLNRVNWKGIDYKYYRDQVNSVEKVIGLNMPRSLTSKVSKGGMGALNPDDVKLLPPNFKMGRESYKERFRAVMEPHLPNPNDFEKYFAAQSIWDDTMAWSASEFIKQNPDHVLVIIVGGFHMEYGGGLPDRIHARSNARILSVNQLNSHNYTDAEILEEIKPSEQYGSRSDYIWVEDAEPSTYPVGEWFQLLPEY